METNKLNNKINITITINRACNLRCSWCYAKDTGFDKSLDMNQNTFDQILDFCKSSNIGKISLIGGEPTVYPNILHCIKELSALKCGLVLISNGLIFKNKKLCMKYKEAGLKHISVSIKSANRKDYKEITQTDNFDNILEGIKNLIDCNIKVGVSWVITEENIDDIYEMVTNVTKTGCNNFFFSFYREDEVSDDPVNFIKKKSFVLKKIERIYAILMKNIPHLKIAFLDPLCLFSDWFVENNLDEVGGQCYAHGNSTLVFDTNGDLITCNTLFKIKFGRIGVDFETYQDYLVFLQTDKYKKYFKKINGVPDRSCLNCKYLNKCHGKCVCNWINYSFNDLTEYKLYDNRWFDLDLVNKRNEVYFSKIFKEIVSNNTTNNHNGKYTLIFGYTGYSNKRTTRLTYKIPKSVYNTYTSDQIAFIPSNNSIPSSALFIMSLLFNSYDFSIQLLSYLTKTNQINKLVDFLIKKNVYLINFEDLGSNFSNAQADSLIKNAEKVLICGDFQARYGKIAQNNKNLITNSITKYKIPLIKTCHPSANNINSIGFHDIWYYHDDSSPMIKTPSKFVHAHLIDFIIK